MESSWSQLEHRFDAWVSFSTVSSVDGPSPKSIFSRASPLASDSWRLTAASYSRLFAHIFRLSFDRAALASTASWFTLRFSVLPRFKVRTQSLINLSHAAAGLPDSKCLPQTLSFFSTFFHCDLSPKSTFLVSAQFFSFFSLFINNRRYLEEPYGRVFSAITWTIFNNTVIHDKRCSTGVKWCGSIRFVYIYVTPTWRIAIVVKQLVTWVKTKNYLANITRRNLPGFALRKLIKIVVISTNFI